MKKQYIIPITVPSLDETNEFVFSNLKNKNEKSEEFTKQEVKKIIEEHLKYIKENSKVEIAFLGGSFTKIDEKKQEELLNTAYEYIKKRQVESIRISTQPNCINIKTLKKLKKYKVRTIELVVQSTNDYILKKSGIAHTNKDIKKASKLIRHLGFKLGHQMLVGLPESTHIDEINTAKQLIKLKPKMVRIYPVLVIKNTNLEKEYNTGNYKALTMVQAVETCKELVKIFVKNKIEVIKIGIQGADITSNIEDFKNMVIAGPYNPAFRQLVEARMWYDVIVEKIKKLNTKVKEVIVIVNPIDVNNVIGPKQENIDSLKKVYDVELKVKSDEKIKQGKSKIQITKFYEDFLEKSIDK